MNRILLALFSAAILAVSTAGCGSDDNPDKNAPGGAGGGNDGGSGGTNQNEGGHGGNEGGAGGGEAGSGGAGGGEAGSGGSEGGAGGEGGEGGTIEEGPRVAEINVIPDCFGNCPTFIPVGGGAQYMAEALDQDGNFMPDVTFTWSSENEAIATIDEWGYANGVSNGTVRLIASAEGVSGSIEVEVKGIAEINVIPDCFGMCPSYIMVRSSAPLMAEALDADGDYMAGVKFDWSSGDEGIATVDEWGLVTGVSEGTVAIIASAQGVSGTFEVEIRGYTPVKSIKLSEDWISMLAGVAPTEPLTVNATAKDVDGNVIPDAEIHWVSVNPLVLTLTPDVGLSTEIVGMRKGETWIRVFSPDGLPGSELILTANINITTEPATGAEMEAVAVGGSHTCGLHGGVAYCWGSNEYGQLGRGFTSGPTEIFTVPAPIESTETFTRITAGDRHTCAISSSQKVWCWGDNSRGQLGVNQSPSLLASSSTPMAITSSSNFLSIDAGLEHTCGVNSSNYAICWGNNADGQTGVSGGMGIFATVDDDDLTLLPDMPGGEMGKVIAITAGRASTCAIQQADGAAWCWGNNDHGALGTGSTTSTTEPAPVDSTLVFETIAMSADTACAISGAKAWCWGDNSSKQLGEGTTKARELSPLDLGASSVTAVAPGRTHTCLISTNQLRCVGGNDEGQAGIAAPGISTRPNGVSGGLTPTSLSTFGDTNCVIAVEKTYVPFDNPQAWCWGSNAKGQLGGGFEGGFAVSPWPTARLLP